MAVFDPFAAQALPNQGAPGVTGAPPPGPLSSNPFDPTAGSGPAPTDYNSVFGIPTVDNTQAIATGGIRRPGALGGSVTALTGILGDIHTVNDLMAALDHLTGDQLRQVQSDLANAGYYGTQTKVTDEPTWGTPDAKTISAFHKFILEAMNATASGQDITAMLDMKTKQFSAMQTSAAGPKPIYSLGLDHVVDHLDPNATGDTIDKTALATLGFAISPAERATLVGTLDAQHVAFQMAAFKAQDARQLTDAQTKAAATSLVDPATGAPADYNKITQAARALMGTPYVWGGKSPSGGLDCSGLTAWVYQQAGINIGAGTGAQFANAAGHPVDMNSAQPGDLVFFDGPDGPHSHVGIFIGNGMMIDAPHTGASVRIDPIAGFGNIAGVRHFDLAGVTTPSVPQGGGTGAFVPGSLGDPNAVGKFLDATGGHESGGNYNERSHPQGASGKYQFMPGTWRSAATSAGYGQYANGIAADAPPAVQDAVARTYALNMFYANGHDWGNVSNVWYLGHVAKGNEGSIVPPGNSITPDQYKADVLHRMGMGGGNPGTQTGASATGNLISTPPTFTDVTTQSLPADVLAALRKSHPVEAEGHDWLGAYGWLSGMIQGGSQGGGTLASGLGG